MTTRTVERIEQWESRPFDGGYAGLQDLVDASFSGVVTAGQATACLLNGTVVGILDGTIEDFEDASGTIREAPSPALPLLIVMQERADEVRAKYYSEETPLSAADQKLSDGGFTGYVELSENVLSGDYYVVYHGGESMSVAYVGQSDQLLSDDEAFERADDEVGIYKVYPVDIEPIDVPEPETADPADETAVAGGTAADDDAGAGSAAVADEDDIESGSGAATAGEGRTAASPDAGASATDDPDREREPEADSERTGTASETDREPDTPPRNDSEPQSARSADARETDPDGEEVTGGLARRDRASEDTETAGDEGDRSPRSADDRGDRSAEGRGEQPTDDRESRSPEGPSEQTTESRSADGPSEQTRDRRDGRTTESRSEQTTEGRSEQTTEDREVTDRGDRNPEGRGRERRERESSPASAERAGGTRDEATAPQTAGEDRDPATAPGPEQRTGGSDPLAGDSSGGADPLAEAPDPAESASGDLERRSIPSVDPDRTWTGEEDGPSGGLDTSPGADPDAGDQFEGLEGPASGSEPSPEPRSMDQPRAQQASQRQPQGQSAGRKQGSETDDIAAQLREKEQTIESLEADLADLEAERDDLAAEADDLAAEADELEAQLRRVREERDELQAEVERLRSKVSDLEAAATAESGSEAAADADMQLSPQEAIEETNLFVRYDSKGEATLEAAHDGKADKEDVAENLDLEYHTSFDATQAAVGDEPFEEFLTDTIQYRFVDWVVHDLLYEIRDTGHADALRDLFDALPKLDRAELNGVVSVTYTEDGKEQRTQEAFDIVLRDRMGNPIAVADLNDSRAAATDEMMTSLVTQSTRAGESHDTLAGAFFVTASFFDPDALETADEATGGGLLSRDKRESYVRLGRKQGYHLCLVEARDSKFHLAVPEL